MHPLQSAVPVLGMMEAAGGGNGPWVGHAVAPDDDLALNTQLQCHLLDLGQATPELRCATGGGVHALLLGLLQDRSWYPLPLPERALTPGPPVLQLAAQGTGRGR